MNTKHLVIGMLVAACLMAAVPTASADAKACNNYGIAVNVWVEGGNCNAQQCYMGTGAAAGAGAAGAGGADGTGAEATAGSDCEQGSGGSGGGSGSDCLGGESDGTSQFAILVLLGRAPC